MGAIRQPRREIARLFDEFHPFGWRLRSARSALGFEMPKLRGDAWTVAPAMDLVETEKEYEISAELPGIDEKNVEIKVANRTLTIKGEKKEEKEEKYMDYYLSERRYGSFQRSFALPEGIDADKIEANFERPELGATSRHNCSGRGVSIVAAANERRLSTGERTCAGV